MEYLIGAGNRRAWRAARALVEGCEDRRQALLIRGDVGTGKTRLLTEMAAAAKTRRVKVLHIGFEALVTRLSVLIATGSATALQAFRSLQLLVLDDAATLFSISPVNSYVLQEVLDRCLVNASFLCAVGESAPAPEAVKAVRDRVGACDSLALSPPDRPFRQALLKKDAEERLLPITPKALRILAAPRVRDIRELERVIKTLVVYQRQHHSSLNVRTMRTVMSRDLLETFRRHR